MAQELLPLGPVAKNGSMTSEVLSSSLGEVLDRSGNADEAAQFIVGDPALLAECRAAYPEIERLASSAGHEGVYIAMQPLILLFGRPDYGRGEAAEQLKNAWVQIFGDALHKLSRESLDYAVAEWIKHGKPFFPKPSELYKLAEKAHIAANSRAWRMRKAIERADSGYVPRPEPTEAEREAVRAMMAELRVKLGCKSMASSQKLASSPAKAAQNLRRMAG